MKRTLIYAVAAVMFAAGAATTTPKAHALLRKAGGGPIVYMQVTSPATGLASMIPGAVAAAAQLLF